jgi:hypothetical protein
MVVLHIEHTAPDYDTWKNMFDKDPADRKGSGVRHYRVSRGVEDPSLVSIDMELDDQATAEALLARLRPIWQGAGSAISNLTVRIVTVEEEVSL